jgi:hypothetical protein
MLNTIAIALLWCALADDQAKPAPASPVPAKIQVPVLRSAAGKPASPELIEKIIAANRAWLQPAIQDLSYTYRMRGPGTKSYWEASVAIRGREVTVHVAGKNPKTDHDTFTSPDEGPRHLLKAVVCGTPLHSLALMPEARRVSVIGDERLGSNECWVLQLRSGGKLHAAAAKQWEDGLRAGAKRPRYEYEFTPVRRVKQIDGRDGAEIRVKSLHAEGPGWPAIVAAHRAGVAEIRWGGEIVTAELREFRGVRQPVIVCRTDRTFKGKRPITGRSFSNAEGNVALRLVLGEGEQVFDEQLFAKRLAEEPVPGLSAAIEGGLWDTWSGGFFSVEVDQMWIEKRNGLTLREELFSKGKAAAVVEYADYVALAGGGRVPRRIEFAIVGGGAFGDHETDPWVFRMKFAVHGAKLWLLEGLSESAATFGTITATVSNVKLGGN